MADRIIRNIIGGESVDAADGRTTDLINPSTGEVFASAVLSGPEDIDRACLAAQTAFESWRDTTPSQRQMALLKIADTLEAHAEQLVAAESENTGKPLSMTMSEEIPPMIDQIRFFAGAARSLEGKSAGEYMANMTSFVRREPIGVCAQVAPWNYPMMMAVWKWAPALAAGNTVVLKPSDTTPVSAVMMAELMSEHLPPGVINIICGDRDSGRALVDHDIPQLVSVTGSVRAGMEVAAAASKTLKRCHLELGGKAPVVVFDDADIAAAAEAIALAGYFNAGQDCTAACRVLVGPGIYDEFTAAITEQAAGTVTGAPGPADDELLYGPLNNANQIARVQGFIERLPDHARITNGGTRVDGPGYFFSPTVVADVVQTDEIVTDEVFGPVISIQKFSDEDQAVAWANGVEYGLSSSVWTKDHGRAMRMSKRLDFGCVWINTHIPLVAEMPHGGFKKSGYGKDLSAYAIDDYTRIKHVMTNLDA